MIVPGFSRVTMTTIADGYQQHDGDQRTGRQVLLAGHRGGPSVPAGDDDMTNSANGLYRGHDGCQRDEQGNLRQMCDWADNRAQHFTTIRYRINQKTWLRTAANTGVFSASQPWKSEGANVPLASEHTGGVNALAGDGSVRFLRDSTDLLMLARYATRDDGGVMNID